MVKNPPANAGDTGGSDLVPGSERSTGEENGNPPHYLSRGIASAPNLGKS